MDKELKEQIADVFSHAIEPVRVSIFYKLGLLLVCGMMLLLPVVYLLIAAALGYGLFYHAVHNVTVFDTLGARAALIVYVGPLAAGVPLLYYLTKPLLPRFHRRSEPLYVISEENEPDFYHLVEQVCQTVKAPMPKQIELTMEVNASAGFRRGIFSFLFGGDLVLQVGLPLLSSLTIQQMAGVLAHEMGHFSQGAGMRLSYVINRVNFWFVEAIYGAETLGRKLENTDGLHGSAGLLLMIIQLFVLLARGVLYLLMMLGYLFSNFLSRQMEFDADLYQIRVSGSTSFESTMYSIVLLDIAFGSATAVSMLTKSHFLLCDDLPALVKFRGKEILTKNKEEVINSALEPETRIFDTHPSPRDRIACAKRQQENGICKVKESAAQLFADFPVLSKKLTKQFYEQVLGPKTREFKLMPPEQYMTHFNDNLDRYHPQTRRVAI